MKKIISVVLAMIMVFSSLMVLPVTVSANTETSTVNTKGITFAVSDAEYTYSPEETIKVPIHIAENQGFVYLQLEVSYDSDVLSLVGWEEGDIFPYTGSATSASDKRSAKNYTPYSKQDFLQNPFKITYLDPNAANDTTATGKLITLEFKMLSNTDSESEIKVTPISVLSQGTTEIDPTESYLSLPENVTSSSSSASCTITIAAVAPAEPIVYTGNAIQLSGYMVDGTPGLNAAGNMEAAVKAGTGSDGTRIYIKTAGAPKTMPYMAIGMKLTNANKTADNFCPMWGGSNRLWSGGAAGGQNQTFSATEITKHVADYTAFTGGEAGGWSSVGENDKLVGVAINAWTVGATFETGTIEVAYVAFFDTREAAEAYTGPFIQEHMNGTVVYASDMVVTLSSNGKNFYGNRALDTEAGVYNFTGEKGWTVYEDNSLITVATGFPVANKYLVLGVSVNFAQPSTSNNIKVTVDGTATYLSADFSDSANAIKYIIVDASSAVGTGSIIDSVGITPFVMGSSTIGGTYNAGIELIAGFKSYADAETYVYTHSCDEIIYGKDITYSLSAAIFYDPITYDGNTAIFAADSAGKKDIYWNNDGCCIVRATELEIPVVYKYYVIAMASFANKETKETYTPSTTDNVRFFVDDAATDYVDVDLASHNGTELYAHVIDASKILTSGTHVTKIEFDPIPNTGKGGTEGVNTRYGEGGQFRLGFIAAFDSLAAAEAYAAAYNKEAQVTYMIDGHVVAIQEYASGEALVYPTEFDVPAGYEITGWDVAEGTVVEDDMTITATFSEVDVPLVTPDVLGKDLEITWGAFYKYTNNNGKIEVVGNTTVATGSSDWQNDGCADFTIKNIPVDGKYLVLNIAAESSEAKLSTFKNITITAGGVTLVYDADFSAGSTFTFNLSGHGNITTIDSIKVEAFLNRWTLDDKGIVDTNLGCLKDVKVTVGYAATVPYTVTLLDGEDNVINIIPSDYRGTYYITGAEDDGYIYTKWTDGTNTYEIGDKITVKSDLTLMATERKLKTYTLSYNANGGEGAPEAQTITHGVDTTLSGAMPTREGYNFLGWATSANGSVMYIPGGTFNGKSDVTLYAVWELIPYDISYNANGGENAPAPGIKKHGIDFVISSIVPTREGYNFLGWSASADGEVQYSAGDTYSDNADLELYAVWELKTYTIKYDVTGGETAPVDQIKTHGEDLVLSTFVPSREGHRFLTWMAIIDSSPKMFSPGSTFSYDGDITLSAIWSKLFTITYNANGGGNAPYAQTKIEDINLSLSTVTPTRDGHDFLGWATSENGEVEYNAGDIYSANEHLNLYAVWRAHTYEITYNANGGASAPDTQTKTYGIDLTLSSVIPTRDGHDFLGWATSADGEVEFSSGDTYTANEGTTLHAVWEIHTYEIAYNANGGVNAPESQTKTYGIDLTLSSVAPTRDGHDFLGWATSADGEVEFSAGDTYTANEGTTLHAVWKIHTYEIAYNANGGADAPESQTKTYGIDLTLSSVAPTRDGHDFLGWATSENGEVEYASGDTYTANTGATLYAVWKIKTYTISYDANGGDSIPAPQTKTYGIDIVLRTFKPTRDAYDFTGWSTSPDGIVEYVPGSTYSQNSSVTLYAVWKLKTYDITYNANGGANAPYTQTKTYGIDLTLSSVAPTRDGHDFLGWATSENGEVVYALGDTYTANIGTTLYAVWKAHTYEITYNANGGANAPDTQTKTYGIDLTLSSVIPTRDGHDFLGWATSENGEVVYALGDTYTANIGATLYAVWEAHTYEITYNANGGANAPESQTKTYGIDLTLSSVAPTRDGHDFLGWATSENGEVEYDAGDTYTANSEANLYAVWEEIIIDETAGDVTGDGKTEPEDAVIYARKLANWKTVQDIELKDLNGDGKIDIMDLIIIQRHLAGWKGYRKLPLE